MELTEQQRKEKNHKAAQARFTKQHNRYESWKSQILSLWIWAKREKMEYSAILKYRGEWIIGQSAYQSLPLWIKYKLDGADEVLLALVYRQDLEYCYPHPDTGVIFSATSLCNAGFASRLKSEEGNHYWKNEDGTFTHKF